MHFLVHKLLLSGPMNVAFKLSRASIKSCYFHTNVEGLKVKTVQPSLFLNWAITDIFQRL